MHPAVNASWAIDKILRHRRINVGVAVAIDDGLVVLDGARAAAFLRDLRSICEEPLRIVA